MQTVCEIGDRLRGVDIQQLMPLFAIANIDQDKYPGLMSRYVADDPALLRANLLSLGQILSTEEKRHKFLNRNLGPSFPSAQRASGSSAPAPSPSPTPAPTPTPGDYSYPPSRGVAWKYIQQI